MVAPSMIARSEGLRVPNATVFVHGNVTYGTAVSER